MDQSTENVTLLNVFVIDIIRVLKENNISTTEIGAICRHQDLSHPYGHMPIELYNEVCQWIEDNLSDDLMYKVSSAIGEIVHEGLTENKVIQPGDSPVQILEGLEIAASSMIQDPKNRGWDVLESSENHALMRRTQTFNSKLQLGLLEGLLKKAQVNDVHVSYQKEVAKGDEFDKYKITWEN